MYFLLVIFINSKSINKILNRSNTPIIGCPTISNNKFVIKNIPEYNNITDEINVFQIDIKTFPELNITNNLKTQFIQLNNNFINYTLYLPYIKTLYYKYKDKVYSKVKYENKIYMFICIG